MHEAVVLAAHACCQAVARLVARAARTQLMHDSLGIIHAPHIVPLPADLQELHIVLHGALAHAWSHFDTYDTLARLDLAQRKVLGRVAGLYWLLLDTLPELIILDITRMLDSAGSGKSARATFSRLLKVAKRHLPQPVLSSMLSHVSAAEALAVGMRDRRNRQLAHLSLLVATGKQPATTRSFSRTEFRRCLAHLAVSLNAVYAHYESFRFPYSDPLPPNGQTIRALVASLSAPRLPPHGRG